MASRRNPGNNPGLFLFAKFDKETKGFIIGHSNKKGVE